MTYEHIFDSGALRCEAEYKIPHEGFVTILFEKEQILLRVDAQGNAVFCDLSGQEKYRSKVECEPRRFDKVLCDVTNDIITVRFPIIKWIDHYPHCDGEYDRWSEVIVDNLYIRYTLEGSNKP
ncbi:MAG: hypothetical protein IJW14_02200 [Oscillospiraceae bacterium]|nr:hypothetical protein [Oscillospiraceae bacterium]